MRTPKEIGSYIQELCREKDVSITKMESDLKLGNGTIGRWAKQAVRFQGLDKLRKIAEYLGTSLENITGEEENTGTEKPPLSEREERQKEFSRLYATFTDEVQKNLLASLKGIASKQG